MSSKGLPWQFFTKLSNSQTLLVTVLEQQLFLERGLVFRLPSEVSAATMQAVGHVAEIAANHALCRLRSLTSLLWETLRSAPRSAKYDLDCAIRA